MGICEAQGSLGLEGHGSKNRVASNGACITVERQASLTCEVGRTMAPGGGGGEMGQTDKGQNPSPRYKG